jgi:hypothetical protein
MKPRPKMHDCLDVRSTLVKSVGELAIQRAQEIPVSFRDALKQIRHASSARAKNFHHAFSIPVLFVEKFLREGFDIYREPARAIEAKLRREHLDDFIVTTKRI